MSFLHNVLFALKGPVETVCKAISKWEPEDISSEAATQKSLYVHLTRHLNRHDVRQQYPHDRVKADILINEEVAVEIKLNLTTTAKFHRLIGQLESYARWDVRIVVLLVGRVDPELKRRVEERLRQDWEDEDDARVVHVPA